MAEHDLYSWEDSVPYLGYIIVRRGNKYSILNRCPHCSEFNQQFETVKEAIAEVNRQHLEDLLFNLLILARDQALITEQQREDVFGLINEATQQSVTPTSRIRYPCVQTCAN